MEAVIEYGRPLVSMISDAIPRPSPEYSYWYKGDLPTLKGAVVNVTDVLSTIHPNYLLVATTFVFAFFVLYIKMQYPFWNQVPALHTYDWHRRLFSTPYIIHDLPKKTKYYESAPLIETSQFQDISVEKRTEMVKLLQNNYLPSDRVFCSLQLADFEAQNRGSIVSTYNLTSGNTIEKTIRVSRIEGFSTSRSINLSVALNSNERVVVLEPAEYIDYICFDKTAAHTKKMRCLFHTHEFNQRIVRPTNKITLFKKEVERIDALVPLVKYYTLSFYLRWRIEPAALPTNWQLVRIQREHRSHLHDFVERIASLREYAGFSVAATMEIGEALNLLQTNQLFAYALRGPDGVSKMDAVYAIYFFRNAHMKYEDLEGADTVHCVAAFRNTDDFELFFIGYFWALREVVKSIPTTKMLMMDDIGHLRPIVERWISTHDIVLRTPCAYYLTNYVVPGSPYNADNALVLI